MFCKSARLIQFRNFADIAVPFSSRLNVLVGENGHGKTNLIEALHLAISGESFRFASIPTLIAHGCNESLLQLEIDKDGLNFQLKVEIQNLKKRTTLNGKAISNPILRKNFGVVLFSPESLNSIKEGAENRRQLIDDLLVTFEPKNSVLLQDYRKALRMRNRILRNYVDGLEEKALTISLLESLNPQFFKLAAELVTTRLEALQKITPDFNQAMKYISKSEAVDISVEYVVSKQNIATLKEYDLQNMMEKRGFELRDAELASGTSLVGPHKHDIQFLYGQKDSRIFCSQGQQRAIILSFKIAQIVYHRKVHGIYPLLLLDDVLSELDKGKREALIGFLHEIKTQTFITTTDFTLPESFQLEEIAVIKVMNGKIFN